MSLNPDLSVTEPLKSHPNQSAKNPQGDQNLSNKKKILHAAEKHKTCHRLCVKKQCKTEHNKIVTLKEEGLKKKRTQARTLQPTQYPSTVKGKQGQFPHTVNHISQDC